MPSHLTSFRATVVLTALALAAPAGAACPGSSCLPGGGPEKTDCVVEIDGIGTERRIRCEDGDPACDTDGVANGSCRFAIRACFNVSDPALPRCTPSDVASFTVKNAPPGSKRHDPQLAALAAAAATSLPTAASVCTGEVPLYVPLTGKGRFKAGKQKVRTVAETSSGAKVQTDYVLEPGASAVRIETTLRNTGAAPFDTLFGDTMNGSGQVELFQDTYGFGEPLVTQPCVEATYTACAAGMCDPCNVVAWSGDESAAGVSYGYVHAVPGTTSFSVSGVTASLLGNQVLLVLIGAATPNVHLAAAGSPGDAVTLTRWFVVGEGSVGDITTARNAIQQVTTGTLEGTVTEAGAPAANADVAVLDTSAATVRVVTHFRTDAAGRFQGTLAPGPYEVRVQRDGRPFPSPEAQTIDITAGATTMVTADLPPPGFLEVHVTDEDGAPLTAKVTVVGFDPSPEPTRFESIFGVVSNVTRYFGDQGDNLPYGVTNVFLADRSGTVGPVAIEPGRYQVVVSRGTRYADDRHVVDVAGDTVRIDATLTRVVETPGFVVGDFHSLAFTNALLVDVGGDGWVP